MPTSMKVSVLLLASVCCANPPAAVVHQQHHVDVGRSPAPSATDVVRQHSQVAGGAQHESGELGKVVVEKLTKVPVIGNGIVTAIPFGLEEKQTTKRTGTSAEVVVEKLTKVPVIGNGIVTAIPFGLEEKQTTKRTGTSAKPAVARNGIVTATPFVTKEKNTTKQADAKSPATKAPTKHASQVALGKVASTVNITDNGTVSDSPRVWCGGLYAASCGTCPQGNGAMWCHGHCHWTGLQCVLQSQPAVAHAFAAAVKVAAPAVHTAEAAASREPSASGPRTLPTSAAHVESGTKNATRAAAGKPLWAHRQAAPQPAVAAIRQADATKAVTRALLGSGSGAAHFLSAHKKEDECTCGFHGVCTCEASMAFMDCISTSCTAGCDCHGMQYHDACTNLQSACGDMGLTFDCDKDKATCIAEEHKTTPPPPRVERTLVHSRPLPHLDAPPSTDAVKFLYHSLQEMKEDKCQLEAAVLDGYVNADARLGVLAPHIEAKLRDLEHRCLKIPELRCDKDFEEFSSPPPPCGPKPTPAPPKEKGSGSCARLALGVVVLVAASAAHP